MQCTCPSYNANNKGYSTLNRQQSRSNHSIGDGGVANNNCNSDCYYRRRENDISSKGSNKNVSWYSSQTLPNPKRQRQSHIRDSCPCDNASCVFSSNSLRRGNRCHPRNDPRGGNPVKSCLNISTASSATAPLSSLSYPQNIGGAAASVASLPGNSVSRADCYLCSRSWARGGISQLQQHQRERSHIARKGPQRQWQQQLGGHDENQPPPTSSGPYLVSDFATSHLAGNLEQQQLHQNCYSSSKSINSCQALPAIPWRCCFDSNCGQINRLSDPLAPRQQCCPIQGTSCSSGRQQQQQEPSNRWSSAQSLSNYCSLHRQNNSLVNIFSNATRYQQQPVLHFDESLCQPNYWQRKCQNRQSAEEEEEDHRSNNVKMTAGSCLSNNNNNTNMGGDDDMSPPSSPNIPPPPLPPLSRAPSLGGGSIGRGSIGMGSGRLRHNSTGGGGGMGTVSGCPKCRFATIATPTHNRHGHNNSQQSNGGVCGSNYSHVGYHHHPSHHQSQQHHHPKTSLAAGNHHYGSQNSYSGEYWDGKNWRDWWEKGLSKRVSFKPQWNSD